MAAKPSVDVDQIPHYRISAEEVARWLDQQGPNSWWTIDGDPYLMERIALPALSDQLAEAFRRAERWLIILDPQTRSNAKGETLNSGQLDALADHNPGQDRVFYMCWEDDPWRIEWLLAEDKDLSVISQGLNEIDEKP